MSSCIKFLTLQAGRLQYVIAVDYLEEIVLLNERIIKMTKKSMGDRQGGPLWDNYQTLYLASNIFHHFSF